MRQGPNKRPRNGRVNGRRPHHNGRSSTIESSGGDSKIKGTASQVAERYLALARDALAAGDRVGAENYLQHAEHYNRLLHGGVEPASLRDSACGPHDGNPADGEATSVNESAVPEEPNPKPSSA